MIFKNDEHKCFFTDMLQKTDPASCYHQAFFYTAGLNGDTRRHIHAIFDLKENCIRPEGLHQGWQTSGSRYVTLLAFNLWNGYLEQGNERDSTPYNLFCTSDLPYFMEAVKLRYPEYYKSISRPKRAFDIQEL